jgi:hypothetical protein
MHGTAKARSRIARTLFFLAGIVLAARQVVGHDAYFFVRVIFWQAKFRLGR